MDLPREGAYLRRCREAVPASRGVQARPPGELQYFHCHEKNVRRRSRPGRGRGADLRSCENVFVFDAISTVFNPTDVFWAIAPGYSRICRFRSRTPRFSAATCRPSLDDEIKTSCMIVDATKPLDRPFSPVSKCPDEAMARIKLADFVPGEVLQHIPMDRTTYWA